MNRNNTALLVIDPVNSCVSEQCETPERNIYFSKIRSMLPILNQFIKNYRNEINTNVFIANLSPWNKDHLPNNIQELYTDPKACYYSDNTTGYDEQFTIIELEKTDVVITKNTYDVFSNKSFVDELNRKGIKYIVTTGVFTDGCVLASIVSGFSKGYNFVILKDLIETTDNDERQQLQKLLISYTFPKLYGLTITSTQLLQNLPGKD